MSDSEATVDQAPRVANLSDDQRRAYEAACEGLEVRMRQEGIPLSVLLAEVDVAPPVRVLVMLHLGKIWLEAELQAGRALDVEAFFLQVPELQTLEWAHRELEIWIRELSKSRPRPDAPSWEIRGRKFQLPVEYELLHRLQDKPEGMSLVLLVRDLRLDRKVVLKAINPARLEDERAVRRFLEEPRKASQTNHPAIVQVLHASPVDSPCPFYTMEYLEGGSLTDLLNVGPLPSIQAVKIIAIVARALHHVHKTLEIAHGDLKPENILLDKEGKPKLTDFGLWRSIISDVALTSEGSGSNAEVSGTPGFIAPEQVDARFRPADYTKHQLRITSDLFALGATLYCSLTCRIPYHEGTSRRSWFAAVVNELVPVQRHNPTVDDALDAITQKCLSKHPDQRFASADELADVLEAWLSQRILEDIKPLKSGKDATFSDLDDPSSVVEDATFIFDDEAVAVDETGVRRWWRWAVVAIGLLSLVVFRPWNRFVPEPVSGTHVAVSSGQPVTVHSTKPPPLTPAERLVQKGWSKDAATSVAALNAPWLETVRQVNPSHADKQFELLERLGGSSVSLDICRDQPHRGALLATLPTAAQQRDLKSVLTREEDGVMAERLFSLYPSPEESNTLAALLKSDAVMLRELGDRGWLGCEAVLLRTADTQAERVYNSWLQWIVKNRLLPSRSEEECRRAAEYQAYAVVYGPILKGRLDKDEKFRARFLSEIWPAFVSLIDEKVFSLPDVFQVDALWDYLARETKEGHALLKPYGLAPVALLYGPHADDFKGMHDRIVTLLKSGNKSVVSALFEPRFRGVGAFRSLVAKRLSVEVLAAALNKAREDPAILNDYARRDEEFLRGELSWNPDDERAVEGRLVYLKLPLKLLSGKELYSREKTAFYRQAFADVATVVMLYYGMDPNFQNGLKDSYWSVVAGVDALTKAQQKKFLEENRRRFERGETPRFLTSSTTEQPLDYVQFFERTHQVMDWTIRPEAMDPAHGFDVAVILRMYKKLLGGGDPRYNAADRPDVRMVVIQGDRLAITIHDESHTDPIRQFFNTRGALLMGQPSVGNEERTRAWREAVSAWWLLHASRQLDLLDPLR